MAFSRGFLISVLVATAYAANDWGKPCFDGECSYDIPQAKNSKQSAVGTVRIWGAKGAIADITSAAGWEVVGCSPTALSQDIRLVCKSDDAEAACNNLFEHGGAVDKIVRLPEHCGANAFARISRSWVPEDQSLPESVASKIVRRAGVTPQVKAISVDTNFSAVDPAKNGPVNIALVGINQPGYTNPLRTIPVAQLSRSSSKRGFWDWVEDTLESFTDFDLDESINFPPIDIDKPYTLLDQSVTCGAVRASIKVDVDAKAHAVISVGVVAAGTVIPPDLDELYVYAGLNADLSGTLSLNAEAVGEVTTGDIKLYEVGLPGLDWPGLLQVGPAFKINALARAFLDVKLDVDVGLNYKIQNARLVFPPSASTPSTGSFGPADTPLQLSVSPSVTADGTLEAHIKPQLDVGLDAFAGLVGAHVFLNLETHASLDLSLQAGAHVGVGVDPFTGIVRLPTGIKALPPVVTANPPVITKPPVLTFPKGEIVKANAETPRRAFPRRHLAALDARDGVTTTTDTYFNGCIGMTAGLSVNAGADASFMGLFDKSTSVTLYSHDFNLFKKCWGNASFAAPKLKREYLVSRGLSCTTSGSPVTAVDQVVMSGDIKAI